VVTGKYSYLLVQSYITAIWFIKLNNLKYKIFWKFCIHHLLKLDTQGNIQICESSWSWAALGLPTGRVHNSKLHPMLQCVLHSGNNKFYVYVHWMHTGNLLHFSYIVMVTIERGLQRASYCQHVQVTLKLWKCTSNHVWGATAVNVVLCYKGMLRKHFFLIFTSAMSFFTIIHFLPHLWDKIWLKIRENSPQKSNW